MNLDLVNLGDEELDQVLEYSAYVRDLGPSGAPGAAHALAHVVPVLVRELVAERGTREAQDRKIADLKAEVAYLREVREQLQARVT